MTKKKEVVSEEVVEAVEAVDIIRGRMPLAMVYAIRFVFDGTDGELARKFRTTPGKINDIKKSRNFGYVTEDVKFSQEDIDKALERAGNLGDDDVDEVVEALEAMGVATEAEVTALEEARKSTRKPRGKTADEPGDSEEVLLEDADEEPSDEDLEDLL